MQIPKSKIGMVCSGMFLTEVFPAGWENLPDEELLSWIDEHRWESFEHMDVAELADNIESAIRGVEELLEDHGVEVSR